MKLLNLLIVSEQNPIASIIVDYLIDSGHNIIIDSGTMSDPQRYTAIQNINLINDKGSQQSFDFLINFIPEKKELELHFPSICIYYDRNMNTFQCIIKTSKDIFKFSQPTTSFNSDNFDASIADLIIDAIIHLSRQGTEYLCPVKILAKAELNYLYALTERERSHKQFIRFESNLEKKGELFTISQITSTTKTEHFSQQIIKRLPYEFSELEFEIFILAILYLLSGRKEESLIGYRFISSKVNKYKAQIVSQDMRYPDLAIECEAFENQIDYPVNYSNNSEITLTYDYKDIDSASSPLSINYNLANSTLEIRYPNELSLFDNCSIWINQLLEKFTIFCRNEINLYSFMNISDYTLSITEAVPTPSPYQTLPQWFDDCVQSYNSSTALVCNDTVLTYQQLDQQSNQLAHYLQNLLPSKTEPKILLCLERDEFLIITILATFKIGATYIPTTPSMPDARIADCILDCNPELILTTVKCKHKFQKHDNQKILISDEIKNKLSTQVNHSPNKKISSASLAYIIYTSGTTGKPKGVMIEQQSIINLIAAQADLYQITDKKQQKSCLWFCECVFDVHISEIFTSLLYGHCLHILPENMRLSIAETANYIRKQNISIATLPPALLDTKTSLTLETLIVTGDLSNKAIIDRHVKSGIRVINAYGPTEATVYTTRCDYSGNVNIIGKPLHNLTTYILDHKLNILPTGVIGDLYIGGIGLARGYTDSNLTNERFIELVLDDRKIRLYKTGDLARYTANDSLEFFGRKDRQIKLNGFRIELDEIDHVLCEHEKISQSVTLITANKALVSIYCSENQIATSELKNLLARKLPSYMIPTTYLHLSKIPLNINGKTDTNKLLAIINQTHKHTEQSLNEMQLKICKIWSEVFETASPITNINEDFFYLGGDSIKSIQLANRIRSQMKIDVKINDILKHRTIASLCQHLEQCTSTSASSNTLSINTTYPANSLQKVFLSDALKHKGANTNYQIQVIWEYLTEIDVNLLKQAWQDVTSIYSALRLKFSWQESAQQIIEPHISIKWHEHNFTVPDNNSKVDIEDLVNTDFETPYNLHEAPLFRVYILKNSSRHYTCLFSNHHAILDGWSIRILLQSIHEKYVKLTQGIVELAIPKLSYELSQSFLQTACKRTLQYWKKNIPRLNSIEESCNFEEMYNNTHNTALSDKIPKVNDNEFTITGNSLQNLQIIANEYGVTLNAIFLFMWHKIIHVFGHSNQTVIGTILSGRNIPIDDIEKAVGLFIHTVPHTLNHSEIQQQSVISNITDIQKTINELNQLQNIYLSELSIPLTKTFDSLYVYESKNISIKHYLDNSSDYKFYKINESTDYPISLIVREESDEICIKIQYMNTTFSKSRILSLVDTVKLILEQIANTPRMNNNTLTYISKYTFCSNNEANNQKSIVTPSLFSPIQIFEKQVINTPNNIAIISNDLNIDYKTLNETANKFAHYLSEQGVKPGSFVGIYLERSYHCVLAIIAVLKLGAVYIPLDIHDPIERIQNILGDIGELSLIATSAYSKQLNWVNGAIHYINDINLSRYSDKNIVALCSPESLAYVIFTSGTTGTPKGVMVTQANLANYLTYACQHYLTTELRTIPLHTSLAFDMSITSLFCPLITGNSITIINEYKGKLDFKQLIETFSLSHFIKLTPTHLKIILNMADDHRAMLSTCKTKLVVGGEALPPELIYQWQQLAPNIQFYNEYGPTEATVACSVYKIPTYSASLPINIPIGTPLDNLQLYVMNDVMSPLPREVAGEIYIGGLGLASGYLNQPELTQEKFCILSGDRLYKTGDIGMLNSKGEFEYLGRKDNQIKMLGYRINCGEIESAIKQHGDVSDAIVIYDAQKSTLNAFIIAAEFLPEKLEIKSFIKTIIPEYMLPHTYTFIEEIPFTKNGKLDTNKLTLSIDQEQDNNLILKTIIISPEEAVLVNIWQEVLDRSDIKPTDNFFDIGGHSLLATQFISKVKKQLNKRITLRVLFDKPTISELAKEIFN